MGTETGEMGIKTGEIPKVWELKLGKWELKLGKSSLNSLIDGPLQTATYIKLQLINRDKKATYKYLHFYILLHRTGRLFRACGKKRKNFFLKKRKTKNLGES